MKNPVQKIGLTLLALLVMLIIAAVVAPFVIPATAYKAQLQQKIEAITGRKLTIDGAVRLKFFPIIGVYAEKVTLFNTQEFNDTTPLLTLSSMDVGVAVVPLLGGQIDISNITLKDPQIFLHVNAKGAQNWVFGKQQPVNPKDGTTPVALPVPSNMLLGRVEVSNGSVDYVNDTKHAHSAVTNLNGKVTLNGLTAPFVVSGKGDWNGQTVKLDGRIITLESMLAKQNTPIHVSVDAGLGKFDLDGVYRDDSYSGKLQLSSSSLKSMMAWAMPGSKPLPVTGPLATTLNADVDCTPSKTYCSLTNTLMVVDALRANGNLKLGLAEDTPFLGVDLTAGQIDLTPFLPPAKQASLSLSPLVSDAVAETGRWSAAPMDLAPLGLLNATIKIKNEGVIVRNLHIGANTLNIKLERQKLSTDLSDVDLYSGKANITVAIDAGVKTPTFETHIDVKGVDSGALLKDVAGKERLSGKVDVQASLTGYGASEADIIGSLNGSGHVAMPEGTIHGVNLGDMLHNVQSAFGVAGSNSNAETKITNAGGSFTVTKGIVSNNDLKAALPGMDVSGQGTVNLPAYTVNYRVTPQVVSGSGATAQQGLAVPVIIEGSLDNPSYRPDLQSVLKNALQDPNAFKQQLKNSKGSLKDQLKNPKDSIKNLKDMLGGFR